jgi:hypothetical protein
VLGAKVINPKTSHYVFGEIFFFSFFPFMWFIHYHWISQFGEIFPKKIITWPKPIG